MPMNMLPMLLILSALLIATPARAQERLTDALDAVNRYRSTVGLAPVVMDDRMNQACQEHTRYLVLNDGRPELEGLKAHQQDPRLSGATPAGAWCGKNADLYQHVGSPLAAVHAWMNSLYHRTPILSPSLRRVGIAESPHPRGGVAAALMFGDDAPLAEGAWPIRYPSPEQSGVPLEFVGENPNPVPRDGRSGYPITLNFPADAKIRGVEAHLFDAGGAELPLYVSHPGRPAQSFPQGGAVCLLPKRALQPGARHRVQVHLEWQGQPRDYDWSFTTAYPAPVDSRDRAALRDREELPALVRGRVLSAWRSAAGKAICLKLSEDAAQPVMTCVDEGEFRRVAGSTAPEAFEGQTVQVLATPRDSQGGLYMSVLNAWQLWFPPQGELPLVDAANPAALAEHVGQRVRVRGLLTEGGQATGGTDLYLHLNDRALVAFVPPALWSAVAGGQAPALLLGQTVEIEALLKRRADYVEVTIADAAQLRLLPLSALPSLDAADPVAMKDAIGRRVKVRGLVTGGGQISNGTDVYLHLNHRGLVVFVPPALWRAIAGGRAPSLYLGHAVEVEAFVVPQGDQLQATVVAASQLHLLPVGELQVLQTDDTAALRRARDQLVTIVGTVSHADYFKDSKDVFLTLKGPQRDSVFLAITAELWRRLAGDATPSTFTGRQIQAQVVPQPTARDLRLQVADADTVKIVRD